MSIHKWYQQAQASCGITQGMRVKVIEAVPTGHNGWPNEWTSSMDSCVGNTYTVIDVAYDGVRLQTYGETLVADYWFPFFALEIVEEPSSTQERHDFLSYFTLDHEPLEYCRWEQ